MPIHHCVSEIHVELSDSTMFLSLTHKRSNCITVKNCH